MPYCSAKVEKLWSDAYKVLNSVLHKITFIAALCCVLLMPSNALAASNVIPFAWLDVASDTAATVRWQPVKNAVSYDVFLNSDLAANVTELGVVVSDLKPASYQQVQIVARYLDGSISRRSDPVSVVTRAAAGCTHYVSTRGSDLGNGTLLSPWRTISYAVQAWQPGAVICLDGSFTEDVSIMRGGTKEANVTLRSIPGKTAQIRGRLWVANTAPYVVIAHLNLDGRAVLDTTRNSLPSPTINGAYAMLLNNDITNQRTRVCVVLGSIRGYGTAVSPVLAYNRIHDCGKRGSNTHHGVYVESTRRARIAYNVIFDNADRGIQLYPDAQQSLITGNVIDGNGTGIIFSGAQGYTSSENLVLRNVIANSQVRSNIEHYWEQRKNIGKKNVAARNCLGRAKQGTFALPIQGYRVQGNSIGQPTYENRRADNLMPTAQSACYNLMLSKMLALTKIA